jgi:hypothetical protein
MNLSLENLNFWSTVTIRSEKRFYCIPRERYLLSHYNSRLQVLCIEI